MSRKKQRSTYEEFISSMTSKQRKEFEKEYKELLISEMLIAAMEQDGVSVRELAKEAGVSPTIIQGIRSGTRENITFKSILKVLSALGYKLKAERDGHLIPIKI
jgi:DNA-binding phage protein